MARPFLGARLVLVGALAGAASIVAPPRPLAPITPVATAAAFQTRGSSAADTVRSRRGRSQGAMRPVDINGDGLKDVIVLFLQEHETVVAFINQGGMRFQAQTIYAAPHPNWGSSGIEVVDLDDDGRMDVLLTHGDSFDDQIVKPYHAIQWLENRGSFPFVEHTLAELPGVQRAQAVDLDGDGDLDIVACALAQPAGQTTNGLPSLVWLEQTEPGKFGRHVIEVGNPSHATLDAGDFDGDGDIELVVGNFSFGEPMPAAVEIFENTHFRRSGTDTR